MANTVDDETHFEVETQGDDDYTEYIGPDDPLEEELYNCNLCGIDFKSITEHIEKYHSGEDVLIDVIDKNDTAIVKTEKSDTAYSEVREESIDSEGGNYTTDDNNIDIGENQMMAVYGDDPLDENDEFLEDFVDDDTDSTEIYRYNESTGALTKTTNASISSTVTRRPQTNLSTAKANNVRLVCKSFFSWTFSIDSQNLFFFCSNLI